MKIFINGKRCQSATLAQVAKMLNELAAGGHTLVADASYLAKLKIADASNLPFHDVAATVPDDADMALSIGGDGTFLRTTKKVAHKGIPIAGINTGRLGYLTAADLSEASSFAADLLAGNFTIEQRTMLQARCGNGIDIDYPMALNEVALLRHDSSAVVSIEVEVNGDRLTTYKADGLIVSTPTGSTAYNLSCGGPIIEPTAANIVLTPISPHSLNMRPLVLPDTARVKALAHTRSRNYQLSLDGNATILPDGCPVTITRAPYAVKVIQSKKHSFASTVRSKLLWGEDVR